MFKITLSKLSQHSIIKFCETGKLSMSQNNPRGYVGDPQDIESKDKPDHSLISAGHHSGDVVGGHLEIPR